MLEMFLTFMSWSKNERLVKKSEVIGVIVSCIKQSQLCIGLLRYSYDIGQKFRAMTGQKFGINIEAGTPSIHPVTTIGL
jgi:hypothetical protein